VFYGFDPSFLLLIPAMIFTFWAQNKVNATYAKYAQRLTASGVAGAEVARSLLDSAGLASVRIEATDGRLTDHYDPRTRMLRLSRDNFGHPSVAALAIAAHEVGHAEQHAQAYAPLALRNNLVPVVNLVSTLAWPLFLIGFLLSNNLFLDIGIWLFVGAVVFQIITLPVEFDASRRAVAMLEGGGYVRGAEGEGVRDMLQAAALTYVAATAVALSQLLRMLVLRNRRR